MENLTPENDLAQIAKDRMMSMEREVSEGPDYVRLHISEHFFHALPKGEEFEISDTYWGPDASPEDVNIDTVDEYVALATAVNEAECHLHACAATVFGKAYVADDFIDGSCPLTNFRLALESYHQAKCLEEAYRPKFFQEMSHLDVDHYQRVYEAKYLS